MLFAHQIEGDRKLCHRHHLLQYPQVSLRMAAIAKPPDGDTL